MQGTVRWKMTDNEMSSEWNEKENCDFYTEAVQLKPDSSRVYLNRPSRQVFTQ